MLLSGTLKALSGNAAFFSVQSHTLHAIIREAGLGHQKKKPQKSKYSSFVDAWVEVSSRYPRPLGASFHLREETLKKCLKQEA